MFAPNMFLQIPPIADLPVGNNFQDHIVLDGRFYTLNKSAALEPKELSSIKSRLEYNLFGTGMIFIVFRSTVIRLYNSDTEGAANIFHFDVLFTYIKYTLDYYGPQKKTLLIILSTKF